jgi:hypothetical protein
MFGSVVSACAQTENPRLQPRKVDELGKITLEQIQALFDVFVNELSKDPTARGYVVNYGPKREMLRRERELVNNIAFRGFGRNRFTIINVGYRNDVLTELWLVPAGAASPPLLPSAYIFVEFGKVSKAVATNHIESYFSKLNSEPDSQGYIINYGTDAGMKLREKRITENITFRKFDSPRITIVRGGNVGKPRTEMWIVPPGAEDPTPAQ